MEWLRYRGSGTRDAWKGLGASVLLHVTTAAVVLLTMSAAPPARAPLVIDLSIGGPWGDGVPAAPVPPREPRRVGESASPGPLPDVPALPAPVAPVPAGEPEPLPAPPKDTTPVAAIPAPTDRQAGKAAPPGPGAVSGVPAFPASAAAGPSQGASSSASTARSATGSGPVAGEPGEARSQARGRYLQGEYAYIRDAIQQGIDYPAMARRMGWEGKVVVSFLVLSDGSVRDVRVVLGSGHPALDRGAVDAVRKAAPFPRPPAEAEIITPVVYRLD
jgi:protein TonB